jgi:hypothetical protein
MEASTPLTTHPRERISTALSPHEHRRRARVTRRQANPRDLELGFDELATRFFEAPVEDEVAPFDTWPKQDRRAMYATFAMLVAAAVLLVSFLFYTRVIMPVPVELGASAAEP